MDKTTIKEIYLARTEDEDLWKDSSSGGVFWFLVKYIIEIQNGVCYGAIYTDNFKVKHARAEILEEAKKFRGSKYVQSQMGDILNDVLEDLKNNRVVLFSGTPCQVKAVKNIVPEKFKKNLILIDILCHGAPSPKFFRDYIKFQENEYSSHVKEIKFRGKKLKDSVQDMYIKFTSGKEYKSFGTQDLYYKFFFNEFISRPSCEKCPFASLNRISDITIADYWGKAENIPKEFNGKIGLSAVYINSQKGIEIWKIIKRNLIVAESDLETCSQPTLYRPIKSSQNKKEFWNMYNRKEFKEVAEYYFGNYKKIYLLRKIKNILNEMGILKIIHKIKNK